MSNKSPLATDTLNSGAPVGLRPKGKGRAVPYTYYGDGKNRKNAYSSNRTKPHKKKK